MPNTLITPSIIAKEALMQLENNLVMANLVHREYAKEYENAPVKVGSTIGIRRPVKFVTSNGATRVGQDVEEKTTPLVVDQRKHVSWSFSTQDLTLTIEEYSEPPAAPRPALPTSRPLRSAWTKWLCRRTSVRWF